MTQQANLERDDVLLLLLLAMSKGGKEKVAGITRIEKLMFLLQKETRFSGRMSERFDFQAWKFGPFSKEIYEDLDMLVSLGLIDAEERDLANYMEFTETGELLESEPDEPVVEKVFGLTDRGRRVAEKLRSLISEQDWNEIENLKRRFDTASLTRLIQYVYHKYPETTEKSVLDHLKPRKRA